MTEEEYMAGFTGLSEEDSRLYQLELWGKGISLHNPVTDECAPDFSCCSDDVGFPLEVREVFLRAYKEGDTQKVNEMLLAALGYALSKHGVVVHEEQTTIH